MFAKLQIHLKEISQNYECVHFPKHNYVLTFIWSHLAGYNTHPQWKILKLKSSRGEDIYVCIEIHPNFRRLKQVVFWPPKTCCALTHINKYPNISHCETVTMMPVCFQCTFNCSSQMHSYSIYTGISSLSQHENV